VALGAASCADFLEIEPRDIVTEDNFWNEKADIDQMVAGCYASMQSEDFINRCIVWGELRSDNIYPGANVENDHYDLYQALRENLLSTNQFTKWASFYAVINKCNTIIRMAPVVSEKDPSYRESDVKATIAEMTALRSLCYFYLIRAFEDVPFYRESVQQEDEVQYQPASSFDYILKEIISDLEGVKNYAIARYPITNQDNIGRSYNSNCNRITRYGIDAMLCDMYLWSGEWDKAIDAAEEILAAKAADFKEFYSEQTSSSRTSDTPREMAAAPYGRVAYLYENTRQNPSQSFDAIFGTGNSFESIFELSFNYTSSNKNYVTSTGLGRLFGSGNSDKDLGPTNQGSGFLTVRPDIVSDLKQKTNAYFQHAYDLRYYNSIQPANNEFGEGTIRKGVAQRFNIQGNAGSADIPFINTESSNFTLDREFDRNWIIYRVTDVMLMEAEALLMKATDEVNETNTELMHKAFDLIYLVNRRAISEENRKLATNAPALATRALMITFLMQERNRELMFEGKRWFDLVRYARRDGKPDIVRSNVPSSKTVGGSSANNGFPSMAHLFWPYNKEELKVNPNLSQKTIYRNEASEGIEMNK
jgi:hypothetical protein